MKKIILLYLSSFEIMFAILSWIQGGGVNHVFVNGVQVLKDGEHTGATPGKVVRGPGYKK
jgi:hypothetical protein